MSKLDWTKVNQSNFDPARVIDVGVEWVTDEVTERERRRRKARLKKLSKTRRRVVNIAPLIIPEEKAGFVGSIMRDLGRALPTKRNRLNNKLKELIVDGLISEAGEMVTDHPLMTQWLDVIETRERRKE